MDIKEINTEKPTDEVTRDRILSVLAGLYEHKTSESFDVQSGESVFADFDSLDYQRRFYPPMSPEISETVNEVIRSLERKEDAVKQIDINEILKRVRAKHPVTEDINEGIENYCIYDFMLRKVLPIILESYPEDHLRVLDVGSGPVIYQLIPFAGISDSIVLSDFLEQNRLELERWKRAQSDFDWSTFFEYVRRYMTEHEEVVEHGGEEVRQRLKEIRSAEPADFENLLRSKIQGIVPVDVFKERLNLGADTNFDLVNVSQQGSAQLITSNFCIESATADEETWRRGLSNVASCVTEGGFLLMTCIRNADEYPVGDKKMPAVPVDADLVTQELTQLGFKIKSISELVGSRKEEVGYDGMVFVLAKKEAKLNA